MWKQTRIILFATLLVVALVLAACGGSAPEAEYVESRASINRGEILAAQDIRVAEYLQYFEQQFPAPSNTAVSLDVRLGNTQLPITGGDAYLQIGLQAREIDHATQSRPLNLAFVIDASESMTAPDKMPLVIKSLKTFVAQLDPDDLVSIVTYNDEVTVVSEARFVDSGDWVQTAVSAIEIKGGSNLHAGMLAGFAQVDANFDIRRNNRVILLTDGAANRGVTNAEQIAADALAYNAQGIRMSTIGMGATYSRELLTTLAAQGNGSYVYLDGPAEVERVFEDNAATFRDMVATNIKMTLVPEPGIELTQMTGVSRNKINASGLVVPLWDLSTNSSQVLLAILTAGDVTAYGTGPQKIATVSITYFDEDGLRKRTQTQDVIVELHDGLFSHNPLWDLEVYRNVVIQDTAEGLKEISDLFDAERYEAAWYLSGQLEAQLNAIYELTNDAQIAEQARLLQRYQQTLADAVYQIQGRAPNARYLRDSELKVLRSSVQQQTLPEVQLDE